MKVVLKQDVQGTGKAGDIVNVSDGFARNMLIPRGMAVEATPANIKNIENQKAQQAKRDAEGKAAAEAQAEALKNKKVVIKTKAGEGGRLFGSITAKDVADAAKEQLGIEVDKKKLVMDSPIKQMGIHRIDLKLYQGVKGVLVVEVAEE